MRLATSLAAAAVPPLLLAALGTTHPDVLTPQSAPWWRDLHVVGLVLFPLLALGPWALLRGRHGLLTAAAVVLGLVYAVFYGALDTLAGVGGGHETMVLGPGPWVSALFGIADVIVLPGVYAYLAAVALAAVVVVVTAPGMRRVAAVLGGVVAVGAAWSFRTSHIYYPFGVATMVALAVGLTALVLAANPVLRAAPSGSAPAPR